MAACRRPSRAPDGPRERQCLPRARHVVHPEDPRAALPRERASGGSGAIPRLDWLPGGSAQETLSGWADDQRPAEGLQSLQSVEELEALFGCLRETETRIQRDTLKANARVGRDGHGRLELRQNLAEHVLILS